MREQENLAFLSTMPAGRAENRLALGVILLSGVIFLALAPFAKVPLAPVGAFIPIYESALVINDLITATLLFGQFRILRSRALAVLACGYLFTALMTVMHALTFPGVFSPTGLLGAGSQSTAWLYSFWHGGFPLWVIAYSLLKGRERGMRSSAGRPGAALWGVAVVIVLVCGFTLLATAGHDVLPVLIQNNRYSQSQSMILATVWLFSLLALAALWRRRPHSVLDLWLMAVLCAWLCDMGLSAVLNQGRFDLGFYAGRIYGLLAASFVLLLLLLENGSLYIRLVGVHEREREKNADLERLNASIQDRVHERTAALDALHNKEEERKAIVDNVVDCIITIDNHGVVRSANQSIERTLGYSADEVIGKAVSMLMADPYAATRDGHLDNHDRAGLARIVGIGREVEGLHKNGERVALELSVSEYRIKGQRFFTGTLHDIRERKRFIAELTQARADAEQANHAKANFLAAMSHEIRTPMNGVIGMIDVLHQSSLKGYQVEMVDLIRESALSLLTIIDDILDFSKIEAGRLEIESAPVALASVTEKVCGLLDHLATRKGVELTLFTDPAIPPEVLGDELRLRQVLINLTNNAIKFSSGQQRAGKVSVRALLAGQTPDRVTVAFQVTDNGIGMGEEVQSGLFSPFAQADVSTTRRFGGTGLGLAISRNLAVLMNGEIAVQSVQGEGSTFVASLPFAPLPAGSGASTEVSEVAGLSCLVVGSPEGLAGDLATYLIHDGAIVEQVPDLAAAREHVQTLALASAPASGPRVWVIDTAGDPLPDSLRIAAAALPGRHGLDIRFVVIGRGPRRHPHLQDSDCVLVDGNALNRRTLLKAVAIAAGRAQEEQETAQSGRQREAFNPPSRMDALRQGRLILVAEDNETNRKVILRQFALLGYAADVTEDGRQALQSWRSGDYALLLTDLHMPEMDGYQLTEAIRTAEENGTRHIPIVALTANALRSEVERCRAAGMDDYLSKPAQLADLKAVLEKWLPVLRVTPESPDSPAAPTIANPVNPVDVSILEGLVGSDPEIVQEFLQDFRAGAAGIAKELRAACQAGEALAAGAAAHKLKSSARSVGALALGEVCAGIEGAGNAGRLDALTGLLFSFERELAEVDGYLGSLFLKKASVGP